MEQIEVTYLLMRYTKKDLMWDLYCATSSVKKSGEYKIISCIALISQKQNKGYIRNTRVGENGLEETRGKGVTLLWIFLTFGIMIIYSK